MPDLDTLNFYDAHASELARRYQTGGPDFNGLFSSTQTVLDIGCGTGRDLVKLLQLGVDAVGCDASQAMLSEADTTLTGAGYTAEGRLMKADLPDLEAYPSEAFDGILCTAVLMHLPREHHFDAMCRIHQLLKPGGKLQLSFPISRPDVDSQTRRDADGRLFLPIDPDELTLLCERIGFQLLGRTGTEDTLGRENIKWCTLRFKRLDQGMKAPLQQVEQILNRDKKSATYKLALFRALAELAQQRPNLGRFTGDGHVLIPVADVAEKWILYYWPLIESILYLPQQNGERPGCQKPTAVRSALTPLVENYEAQGGFQAFVSALEKGKLSPDAARLHREAEKRIRSTIWTMPVKYAGGGEPYSVLQYDKPGKSIRMQADLWRELCLTGSWIADATVLRWAELTHRISGGTVPVSQVVEQLLVIPDPERRVQEARRFYLNQEELECVWTKTRIRSNLEVDHAIPFTLWRNNALWNLLPSSRTANNQKRDKLPTLRLIRERRNQIVHCWSHLHEHFGDHFEREAAQFMTKERFPDDNWEVALFSQFIEAIETTAHLRGSERWEPKGLQEKHQPPMPARSSTPYPRAPPELHYVTEDQEHIEPEKRPFENCLPLVASLAAGEAFHGFDTGGITDLEDLDWIMVPEHLCDKRRFVVRVAGDSMEPTLPQGSLAVFEYHRRPSEGRKIVIANLPSFGTTSDSIGNEAIKFFRQDATHWIFESDNPAYEPIRVSKIDCPQHPILGEFVERV
jgi:SAM-dependent methyltransferase/phage repressor protein C with HTH and peptisase S24 domain